MNKSYVEVNSKNIGYVNNELGRLRGRLLIYAPRIGYNIGQKRVLWGDADFNLFGNAFINEREEVIASPTFHPQSREYTLRQRFPSDDPLSESLYSSFNVLTLRNKYVFEIRGMSIVSCGLFAEKGKTLYVPKNNGLEEKALRYLIGNFIKEINLQDGAEKTELREEDADIIINYLSNDLKTGKIMRHNTQAGQDADATLLALFT